MLKYNTGHGYCSIYTHVNYVQYGGFTRKIHVKYMPVKFTRAITRKMRVFIVRELSSLTFTRKLQGVFKRLGLNKVS